MPRGIAALFDGRRSPWESASAGYVSFHCIRRVGGGRYRALDRGGYVSRLAVVGSAVFVALVFGVMQVVDGLLPVSATIIQLGLAGIGMIGFQLLSPIDAGKRLPHFERAFPFIFWAQGIVFGVLHFQNVATNSPVVAVLSTLPLVICAWLWGFARIYLGLASAVLLHAAYNVPAIAGMFTILMLQGT